MSRDTVVLMSMKDKGVHPGLAERAFRKSTWNSYVSRTSRQQAKVGMEDKLAKAQRRKSDLEALEAAQESRPMKPPSGRR